MVGQSNTKKYPFTGAGKGYTQKSIVNEGYALCSTCGYVVIAVLINIVSNKIILRIMHSRRVSKELFKDDRLKINYFSALCTNQLVDKSDLVHSKANRNRASYMTV